MDSDHIRVARCEVEVMQHRQHSDALAGDRSRCIKQRQLVGHVEVSDGFGLSELAARPLPSVPAVSVRERQPGAAFRRRA
jgi:hypothetical protein